MNKLCRQLTIWLLILALPLCAAGCKKPAVEQDPIATPAAVTTPAPTEEPVEVPEFEISMQVIAGLNSLEPVYDSLLRAMRELPQEWAYYNPHEAAFFWNTLFFLCVNYGEMDSRNTIEGSEIIVPFAVMEEYAAACFYDFITLLPLPEDNYGITIDEGKGAYILSLSDKGDDYVTPVRYTYSASDQYDVMVAWLARGEEYPDMLGSYVFVTAPNAYNIAKGIADPMFEYSVRFAYEDYTDVVLVKDTYERNGKKYALLDPATIRYYNAFDLDENGEQYGYEWSDVVNEQEESIEFLISDLAEFDFGQMDGLFEELVLEDALENTTAFFMENAKRQFEGKNLAFRVNTYDGVLYNAVFFDDNYFVG